MALKTGGEGIVNMCSDSDLRGADTKLNSLKPCDYVQSWRLMLVIVVERLCGTPLCTLSTTSILPLGHSTTLSQVKLKTPSWSGI